MELQFALWFCDCLSYKMRCQFPGTMVIIANAKWHIYVMQQTKKLWQWVHSHHSKWTKYQNKILPYANTSIN